MVAGDTGHGRARRRALSQATERVAPGDRRRRPGGRPARSRRTTSTDARDHPRRLVRRRRSSRGTMRPVGRTTALVAADHPRGPPRQCRSSRRTTRVVPPKSCGHPSKGHPGARKSRGRPRKDDASAADSAGQSGTWPGLPSRGVGQRSVSGELPSDPRSQLQTNRAIVARSELASRHGERARHGKERPLA